MAVIPLNATINPSGAGSVSPTSLEQAPASTEIFANANAGYQFSSWSNWSGCNYTASGNSAIVTPTSAVVKVTANFTQISYSITALLAVVDGRPDTTQSNAPGSATRTPTSGVHDTVATFTASANTGYVFDHWATTGNYASGYSSTSNPTKIAVAYDTLLGRPYYKYVVQAEADTGGTISNTGGNYSHGATFSSTATASSGYVFDAWYQDDIAVSTNATFSWTVTGPAVTGNNGKFIAKFKKIYKLTLSANPAAGGTVSGGGDYSSGTQVEISASSNTGYHFDNWTRVSGNTPTDTSQEITTVSITQDTSLRANFSGNPYSVTLNQQSGSGGTASVSAIYGSAMPSATMPTRAGYTFNGYFGSTGGSGTKYYNANGSSAHVWDQASAKTIYAYWTAATYTVTLNPNGGTKASGGPDSVSITYGTTAGNYPSVKPLPTKTGYTFAGYYDASSGGTQYYNSSGSSVRTFDKTSNTTFYAHWDINTYTITWLNYDGTELDAETYEYGETPSYGGSTPVRPATAQYTYSFSGWTPSITTVTADKSYTATYSTTTNRYTISTSVSPAGGGTVTGAGSYEYGSTPTLTATASTGYTFSKWTKNGSQVSTSATYKPTVTGAATYVAVFTINSYNISVSSNDENKGTVSGGGAYNYGDEALLLAEPKTGYQFVGWSVSGSQVSTDNPYEFTVTSAKTIVGNFTGYNLYLSNTTGGSVSGAGNFKSGTSVTVTASIASGYRFDGWYQGSTKKSSNASYTFTMPSADLSLKAVFIKTYTVSLSASPTGSGTVSGAGTYDTGESVTVTATANDGYTFKNWTQSGSIWSSSAQYTFTIENNRSLVANFDPNKYSVTLNQQSGSGGTASVTATYNAAMPSATMPTRTGYTFNGYFWSAGGVGTKYYNANGTSAHVWDHASAATIRAYWTANTYTITFNKNGGTGGTDSITATYGSAMPTKNFARPSLTGYTFAGYFDAETGGTQYYNANGTSARTWDKTTDTTLYAHWTINSYEVTTSVSPTGSGTTTGAGTYTYGSTCTLTATPATGYNFSSWKQGSTAVSSVSTYSFTVSGSGTYSFIAYFTLKQYTLTVNSNNTTYGTVTGGGTYNHGATASLVATPKTGYSFVGWYKGSTQLSTQSTYSYTVNEAATIEGRFTGISITATAGTGGTVSPSGTNIYASGTSVTLTATANSKYRFAYWLEGSTQYGQNPYTFTATTNRTLTAIFTATRTVSITVNPTGYGTVTGARDYDLNSDATVTATPTTSADITYAFVNWTKGGTSVSTNTSYTFQVTADTALVANFEITAYTIYFNKNGGDGSQNPGTKIPGQSYIVPAKADTLIPPTGKHFVGWNTKADGTGTSYVPGNAYTTDASVTFYAQWALDTYTVKYYGNGNTGGTVPGNQTKTYGVSLTLSSTVLTKSSIITDGYLTSFSSQGGSLSPESITQKDTTTYTHDGWATSAGGTVAYALGGTYTGNAALNLYAHWDAVLTKGTITLPSPGTKTGYTFAGWYTSDAGGSLIGGAGGSYKPSDARTLYAQWTANTYEITFNKNGGDKGTSSINATYGSAMPSIVTPEKTGYAFVGYYDSNDKKYYNVDGSSANTWDKTSATTLYAHWSAIEITVTFDKAGGIGGSNSMDIYYDTDSEHYPLITLPTKGGYDFLGYYDSNNVQYINNSGEGTRTWDKADDVTLTAKWQIVTYTATFVPNAGTWSSGSGTKTQSYKITDVLVVPSTISRTGYGFTGWKVTSDSAGSWVKNTNYNNTPQTKITGASGSYGNVTFTAQWSINTYTIGISADPAIGGIIEKSPDKPDYDYGEEVIIEATPNAGYDWVNWTKGGVQVTTDLSYDITVQASEAYVAHFQPKTIRVTLDANGGEFDPGEQTYVDIEYNSPVGTEVQLPHTPQRGGYQFDGYSDGTQKYIDITEISTTGVLAHKFDKTSNTTFYAIWIPIQYTATYNPGIGHWTGTTSSDDRYETYTVEDLIEGVGSVDKDGYDFRTWVVTAVDQNDCSWHVGDLINYLAGNWGNVTFTAQFDIKTFQITGTPDPSGWGTVIGSGTYNWNAFATLTATAASGYKFKQWNESGTKVSEDASYSFAVTQARTLVAVFEKDSFNVSTSIVPTGAGTVSGGGEHEYASQVTLTKTQNTGYVFYKWRSNHTGSAADYTTSNLEFLMPAFNVSVSAHYKCTITLLTNGSGTVTGAGDYASGSQRTVKATPGTGWGFDGWYENGTKVYSNAEYTFTLTQPRTLTAKFIANSHTVTLLSVPDGAGDLSGGGAKQYGTTVTIEEDADLNYTFTKWVIDWTGHVEEKTTSTAQFQMPDEDVTATAYYDCWVLIQPNNSQWGTTTGSGDYTPGDTCTATATPLLGYRFVNWTNTSLQPVSTNPTYTFTVNNAIELTANFERIANNITYTIKPHYDDGQVFQSPSNPVPSESQVTITASPATGYEFVNWTNFSGIEQATTTQNPFYFEMPENAVSVEANFRPQTFQIQASTNPAGKGTVSGTGSLQYDTIASLTATPITNFEFVNWTENGSVVSTDNPYQFTVNQDRTLVANFKTVSWVFKWTGTEWIAIIPKVWNGSSWEDRMPKKWTGTEWI